MIDIKCVASQCTMMIWIVLSLKMCKYDLQEMLLRVEFLSPRGRNLNWGMAWTSWPFRASDWAAGGGWREEGMVRSNETGQESLVFFRRETQWELLKAPAVGAGSGAQIGERVYGSNQWRERLSTTFLVAAFPLVPSCFPLNSFRQIPGTSDGKVHVPT